jgi:hypothetical protein
LIFVPLLARIRSLSVFALLVGVLLCCAGCRRQPEKGDYLARIGVAVQLPERVCMAIHNPKLLPSATITLIQPITADSPVGGSQTARAQVVLRGAKECPGMKADAEVTNYNLEITTGTLQPFVPVVALDARVPSVYAAHSFHSCTSGEGVHLTAWDGAKPLEGHRLWQQYYYLGQDLAPNCTESETAQ